MSLLYAISASQTDSGSPVDQTLMDAIRLDLGDLDTRISVAEAPSDQDIRDEFAAGSVSTVNWATTLSGAGIAPAITTSDHYVTLDAGGTGAGDYVRMEGAAAKMRVKMASTQSIRLKFRYKRITATARFLVGLQDTGFGTGGWDTSDFIGIISGGAASKFQFINAKAGATTTSSDVGNDANWQLVQIDVVQTGSALSVTNYLDGSLISTSTTNIPDTVTLEPFIFVSGDTGSRGVYRFDKFKAYWLAEPLAP
jgi:hypothetical protein